MSKWGELIPVNDISPYNIGLSSAQEATLIAFLGKPLNVPDNKACYNNLATPATAKLLLKASVGPFQARGIKPAVESLERVFSAAQKKLDASFLDAVGNAGMLCVRKRRPTSGQPSEKLSSHSWGTAIDISFDGEADVQPDGLVQRGIAALIPFFNDEGWYSGVAFKDDTHFEVANETLHDWAKKGMLTP